MLSTFSALNPVIQALLATAFTYAMTAAGAAGVFFGKEISVKLMNGMMGFAAGVMIAASYFSLLAPAIDLSANLGTPGWMPAVVASWAGAFMGQAAALHWKQRRQYPGTRCRWYSRLPCTTS